MANNQNAVSLRTPVFRMSYATLMDPRPYMEDGKPKGKPTYSTEMMFKPEDIANFEQHIDGDWVGVDFAKVLVSVAKAEWGGDFDIKGAVKHGGMKWPIMDGTAKADLGVEKGKKWEAYRGTKFARCKANEDYPPQLFMFNANGKLVELDRDVDADKAKAKKLFVSGYYAIANLNLVPQEVDGKKYLTSYVNSILFYKDGEKIGGMSAEDRFGGISGGQTDYDPNAGGDLDDEIPF